MREERVKESNSRTLGREREIKAGAWRKKVRLHDEGRKIPRRKGGQARSATLGEVEETRAGAWTQKLSRTICRVLVSLLVWQNLKLERRLGDEGPAHKMKEQNESE